MGNAPLAVMTMTWTVEPVSPEFQPDANLPSAPFYISGDSTLQRPPAMPGRTPALTTFELTEGQQPAPLDPLTSWSHAGSAGCFAVAMQQAGLPPEYKDGLFTELTMYIAAQPVSELLSTVYLVYSAATGQLGIVTFVPGTQPEEPVVINDDWAVVVQSMDDVYIPNIVQLRQDVHTLLRLRFTFAPAITLVRGSVFGAAVFSNSVQPAPPVPTLYQSLQAVQLFVSITQSPCAASVTVGWAAPVARQALPEPLLLLVWWTPAFRSDHDGPTPSSQAIEALRAAGVTHWLVRNVLHPRQQVLVPLDQLSVPVTAVCTPTQPCVQFSVSVAVPADPLLPALPPTWLRPSLPSNVLNLRRRQRRPCTAIA